MISDMRPTRLSVHPIKSFLKLPSFMAKNPARKYNYMSMSHDDTMFPSSVQDNEP